MKSLRLIGVINRQTETTDDKRTLDTLHVGAGY